MELCLSQWRKWEILISRPISNFHNLLIRFGTDTWCSEARMQRKHDCDEEDPMALNSYKKMCEMVKWRRGALGETACRGPRRIGPKKQAATPTPPSL